MKGHAMAQVVIHQLVTTEALVWSQAFLCEICYWQSGTGDRFYSEYFIFLLSLSFHWCCLLIQSLTSSFVPSCWHRTHQSSHDFKVSYVIMYLIKSAEDLCMSQHICLHVL